MFRTITAVAILVFLFATTVLGAPPGLRASLAVATTDEGRLETVGKIVGEIQRADYVGDRAALKRHVEALAPFADNTEISSRVRYWRGFALWRRSLNGFNDSGDPKELESDLMLAVDEFDAATSKDSGFVDAKIGAASCLLNVVFLHQGDTVRVRELLAKAIPLLKEAEGAAPDNPRLLWVEGANRWYLPEDRGGGQSVAIQTYLKGLQASRQIKKSEDGPLEPTWGEPELLMNLAWSNLHKSEPDFAAAKQYAESALQLVPYWHSVRDILLPQIRAAESAASGPLSGQALLRDQIVAKEREELEALKTGSNEHFASLLADDALFIDPHGFGTKEEVVASTKGFRLVNYSMDDVHFLPISPEAGLIGYMVVEDGVSHGQPFVSRVHASALWVRRGGDWVCLLSQETPANRQIHRNETRFSFQVIQIGSPKLNNQRVAQTQDRRQSSRLGRKETLVRHAAGQTRSQSLFG